MPAHIRINIQLEQFPSVSDIEIIVPMDDPFVCNALVHPLDEPETRMFDLNDRMLAALCCTNPITVKEVRFNRDIVANQIVEAVQHAFESNDTIMGYKRESENHRTYFPNLPDDKQFYVECPNTPYGIHRWLERTGANFNKPEQCVYCNNLKGDLLRDEYHAKFLQR